MLSSEALLNMLRSPPPSGSSLPANDPQSPNVVAQKDVKKLLSDQISLSNPDHVRQALFAPRDPQPQSPLPVKPVRNPLSEEVCGVKIRGTHITHDFGSDPRVKSTISLPPTEFALLPFESHPFSGRFLGATSKLIAYTIKEKSNPLPTWIRSYHTGSMNKILIKYHTQPICDLVFFDQDSGEEEGFLASIAIDGSLNVSKLIQNGTLSETVLLQVSPLKEPGIFGKELKLAWLPTNSDILAVTGGANNQIVYLISISAATQAHQATLIDAATFWNGPGVTCLEFHTAIINDLSFSPDGTCLATCSDDGSLLIWSIQENSVLRNFSPFEAQPISTVKFLASKSNLAPLLLCGTNQNSKVELWNTISWTPIQILDLGSGPSKYRLEFVKNCPFLFFFTSDSFLAFHLKFPQELERGGFTQIDLAGYSVPDEAQDGLFDYSEAGLDFATQFTLSSSVLASSIVPTLPNGPSRVYCIHPKGLVHYQLDPDVCYPSQRALCAEVEGTEEEPEPSFDDFYSKGKGPLLESSSSIPLRDPSTLGEPEFEIMTMPREEEELIKKAIEEIQTPLTEDPGTPQARELEKITTPSFEQAPSPSLEEGGQLSGKASPLPKEKKKLPKKKPDDGLPKAKRRDSGNLKPKTKPSSPATGELLKFDDESLDTPSPSTPQASFQRVSNDLKGLTFSSPEDAVIAHLDFILKKQEELQASFAEQKVALDAELPLAIERIVQKEIKALQQARQASRTTLEPTGQAKLTTQIEKTIQESLSRQLLNPERLTEALLRSLVPQMQQAMIEGFLTAFKMELLPGFEKIFEQLFHQMALAFHKSLYDAFQQLQLELTTNTVELESIRRRIEQSLDFSHPSSGVDLNQIIQPQLQKIFSSITSFEKSLHTFSSPSGTSLAHQIDQLVAEKKFDDAFNLALSAKDVGLVLSTCNLTKPSEVFYGGSSLSAPTILALIQQLSVDLDEQLQLKLSWIHECLLAFDDCNHELEDFIPDVREQLIEQMRELTARSPHLSQETRMISKLAKKM